nr:D-alanyl-D-alanine carboxypeptidase/D-alanyl-D-alanine-endopeptidase [Streptantibioticus silvisoli]
MRFALPRVAQEAAQAATRTVGRAVGRAEWRTLAERGGFTAVATATGLVAALVAVAVAGPWSGGQRVAERSFAAGRPAAAPAPPGRRTPAVPPAPAVLAGLGPGAAVTTQAAAPGPTGSGLTDALSPLFDDSALGKHSTGAVLDATTGALLYGHDAAGASAPASTTKIATAVAALESRGADYRIPTVVVPGRAKGSVVLVGGGDPTLTAAPTPAGADPDATPASLATLADRTVRALHDRGTRHVTLSYDTSRFTGPLLHPIGVNDNLAAVTALMADEGRTDPNSTEDAPRYADPAKSAAETFAKLLDVRGVTVTAVRPGTAPAGREAQLAEVDSMPLSALVERMLTNSDNDIAEALGRQAAIATGKPVTFTGAGQAVRSVLTKLGMPMAGTAFHDGSGLDREDRLTPDLLARLLLTAGRPGHPELRPVLSGLPVAGFTGTLSDRFQSAEDTGAKAGGDPSGAAGLVRAKTGTLTGVNTLAGTVVDADGRLLDFAFMTSGTTDADAAMAALDRLASAVTNCGCR